MNDLHPTCIPGSDDDNIDERRWELHLSAVFEKTDGKLSPLCGAPGGPVEVCFKPTSSGIQTCVSVSDACAHNGRAAKSVLVATSDLAHAGVDIEIRGGRNAKKVKAMYAGNMRRKGLCSGFRFGGFTNDELSSIEFLTYFLEPVQEAR